MNIRLTLFAGLRQAAGFKDDVVSLPESATVRDLLDSRVPNLRARTFYVAVNEEYAQRNTVLHDGDEVALLPPVSGGRALHPVSLAQDASVGERCITSDVNQAV